jgi:hypothetical protein
MDQRFPRFALLAEAAAELGAEYSPGFAKWHRPGPTCIELTVDGIGWSQVPIAASVCVTTPGRACLRLERDERRGEIDLPPALEPAYRGYGYPRPATEDMAACVAPYVERAAPDEFKIGFGGPGGVGPFDAFCFVVAKLRRYGVEDLVRLAHAVDDAARRIDPFIFVPEDQRVEQLARTISARVHWLGVDSVAGDAEIRCRLTLDELRGPHHAELNVDAWSLSCALRLRGALPPGGPRLKLEPAGALFRRFDKIRAGDKDVDSALFATSDDDVDEASGLFSFLAPTMKQLIGLERAIRYRGVVEVTEDAFVVETGELSRASLLPYVEHLAWAWRGLVARRVGEPARIPALKWFLV